MSTPALNVPTSKFKTTWGQWITWFWKLNIHAGFPFVFWVRPKWNPSEMGDKKGTVVFITGGNSGTGYETALQYYLHGATVYIGCRSGQRAKDAILEIKKGGSKQINGKFAYVTPDPAKVGTIEYVHLDLGNLESVERCAAELLAKLPKLDLFFANAGIMATAPGQFTTQGYPLQFGTNTLGHQRLTSLLLPLLQKTARTQPNPPRVISLASFGHMFTPRTGIDYDKLDSRKEQGKWSAYGESKWGNIAIANYIDAHYGPGTDNEGEILAFSIHPGMVATNLYQHLGGVKQMSRSTLITRLWQISPPEGALNQLWCAEMPVEQARQLSGKFVSCFQTPIPYRPDLGDPAAVDQMWDWCEAHTQKTK